MWGGVVWVSMYLCVCECVCVCARTYVVYAHVLSVCVRACMDASTLLEKTVPISLV